MATKKKPAGAAIYYHPDGFDTSRPKLMGRQSFEDFQARVAKAPTRRARQT